jgi:hypothetical protein
MSAPGLTAELGIPVLDSVRVAVGRTIEMMRTTRNQAET